MIYLNLLVLFALIGVHYYLSKKKGWFKHDHMRLPRTMSFALGILGILIPFTPLFIDGMLMGAVVYFLSEWAYQKHKWSPITDVYNWSKATADNASKKEQR